MRAIFKFTPNSTGAALFFTYGYHRNGSGLIGYARIAKQVSWNASNKTGSCKNAPEAKIMLNVIEMSGMLEAIENKANWKTYHKVGNSQAAITLDHVEGKGFSFKIFKENVNYLVGLSYGEAKLLAISIEANIKMDCTSWAYKQSTEPAAEEGSGEEE